MKKVHSVVLTTLTCLILSKIYIPIYTDEIVLLSTIEELIEACDTGFFELKKNGAGSTLWCAMGSLTKPDRVFFECGSTPNEAVARLWLALNNKNGPKS